MSVSFVIALGYSPVSTDDNFIECNRTDVTLIMPFLLLSNKVPMHKSVFFLCFLICLYVYIYIYIYGRVRTVWNVHV